MKEESCSTCPTKSSCAGGCQRSEAELAEMYDLDADTTEGHMVWVELDYSTGMPELKEASKELIAKARSFDDQRVIGILFGPESARNVAREAFSYGADTIYHVRHPSFTDFNLESFTAGLTAVAERVKPNTLILAASDEGMELGPRTAARMGVGITADCTDLEMDKGVLRMTRPTFGGKLMATIISNTRPQMATVRPGAFPVPEAEEDRQGTVINWPMNPKPHIEPVESIASEEGACLTDAELIISVGGGIGNLRNLELAKEIADRLGAEMACSRNVVEKGWMEQDRQVGQTGNVVKPKVYLALGISGAIQHQTGMSGSQNIIAVNNDPGAAIHQIANVSIIGDVGEFLQRLLKRLDEEEAADI